MKLIEVLFTALALSLDAFAVSLAISIAGFVADRRAAFRLSFHFGLFQFLMPILGWLAGSAIEDFVEAYDHWIAFGLLALVGGHMILSALGDPTAQLVRDPSRGLSLVLLSLATSIDALAVGFSLAMLRTAVWYPSVIVGLVTAGMSVLAIASGRRAGAWAGTYAQIAGGIVLILIGARILLADLGLI